MKTKKGLLRQTGQLVAFVAIVLCSFTDIRKRRICNDQPNNWGGRSGNL